MKKLLWLLVVISIFLLGRVEHTGVEIRRLEPVEVVRVLENEDGISIMTDTGAMGVGKDLSAAVENLQASSAATVFLDTAEYLLLSDQTREYLPQLWELLRPACQVCIAEGEVDLTEAGGFLKTHPPEVNLLQCRADSVELPQLYYQEGRGQLVRGNDYS